MIEGKHVRCNLLIFATNFVHSIHVVFVVVVDVSWCCVLRCVCVFFFLLVYLLFFFIYFLMLVYCCILLLRSLLSPLSRYFCCFRSPVNVWYVFSFIGERKKNHQIKSKSNRQKYEENGRLCDGNIRANAIALVCVYPHLYTFMHTHKKSISNDAK